jgi:DNA-binding NarL/FixJ family response regulator
MRLTWLLTVSSVTMMRSAISVLDRPWATRRSTSVSILTTFGLDKYAFDALRVGASGFLLKDVTAEQLYEGVRVVAAGEALLAPAVTRRLIREYARLVAPPAPGADPVRAVPPALAALTPRPQ